MYSRYGSKQQRNHGHTSGYRQAIQIPQGYSNEGDQFNIKRYIRRYKYPGERWVTEQDKGITRLRTYSGFLFGGLNLRKKKAAVKRKLKLFSKCTWHHHSQYSSVCCIFSVWIHPWGALRLEKVGDLAVTGSRKDPRNSLPDILSGL